MEKEILALEGINEKELDEKVMEELKKGKSKKDIKLALGINLNILNASISRLIKDGKTTDDDIIMYRRETKKTEFLQYLKEGYAKEEAARKVHMGNNEIWRYIEELVEEGRIDAMYLDYGKGLRERNKQAVLEKLREGNTIGESAEILNMNKSVVYEYVRELVAEKRIRREDIVKKIRGKVVKQEITEKKEYKKRGRKPMNKEKKQNQLMSEEEMEPVVIELLENGWKKQEIATELKISFKKLRGIIDKALIEGRIQSPEKKNKHIFKEKKPEEQSKLKVQSDVTRWRMAMNNIAQKFKKEPINRIDKRLYFMYCRRIVESGETLSNKELEVLKKTIVYGEDDVDPRSLKFIGMQYLKSGNLNPAIDMLDECIKIRGNNEEFENAKKIFQDIQAKQDSKLKEYEEVER